MIVRVGVSTEWTADNGAYASPGVLSCASISFTGRLVVTCVLQENVLSG